MVPVEPALTTADAVRAALAGREELGRRYLDWAGRGLVNNWDLVDASAEHLVGAWLLVPLVRGADGASRPPALPERIIALADSRCVWQRRITVLSTFAATRAGADWPARAVARRLLDDPHDLIHKAVGWMLRETGKRVDEHSLTAFLDRYAALMPRTMLRCAVEGLDPDARPLPGHGALSAAIAIWPKEHHTKRLDPRRHREQLPSAQRHGDRRSATVHPPQNPGRSSDASPQDVVPLHNTPPQTESPSHKAKYRDVAALSDGRSMGVIGARRLHVVGAAMGRGRVVDELAQRRSRFNTVGRCQGVSHHHRRYRRHRLSCYQVPGTSKRRAR